MTEVSLGYVPLTDAAPLIIAKELGFAQKEGISLILTRETNWSAIRDKLSVGLIQGAHLLCPMAIAMRLGLGPIPRSIIAPIVLNLNGNTFVTSLDVARRLDEAGIGFNQPKPLGRWVIQQGKSQAFRVGVPYPISMHATILRYWIRSLGVDPKAVLDLRVLPPSLMREGLEAREIDAFMVGAPFGSEAAESADAVVAMTSSAIWAAAPEKVLAIDEEWADANPGTGDALVRAIYNAGLWAGRNENHSVLAEILARPEYLGVGASHIEQMLSGHLTLDPKGSIASVPDAIRFGGSNVSFPWQSQALWIATQEAENWGISLGTAKAAATETFRPDIFRRAMSETDAPLPNASQKVEGALGRKTTVPANREMSLGPDYFFDALVFDPALAE
ncbi:MAG: CmpA/NrtA family ABC transporter substrate-binding protein [Pseudomonadota bacterium]